MTIVEEDLESFCRKKRLVWMHQCHAVFHQPCILSKALVLPDPISTISECDMVSLKPRTKSWIAAASVINPVRAQISPRPFTSRYILASNLGSLMLDRLVERYERRPASSCLAAVRPPSSPCCKYSSLKIIPSPSRSITTNGSRSCCRQAMVSKHSGTPAL